MINEPMNTAEQIMTVAQILSLILIFGWGIGLVSNPN
jgi:hypothetical protein